LDYAIAGHGRMGRAIEREAAARGHRCVATLGADALRGAPAALRQVLAGAEVAFEFSVAEAAEHNIRALLAAGVPVVCGTTGWQRTAELSRVARDSGTGLIVSPNFSLGVNLFFRIVAQAARSLAALGLHEPYVFEAHHRAKRDAPSGTARRLAESLLAADPRLREGTLQVASIRAGSEPGTHVVGFDGPHDTITLRHAARDRAGFALGAVMAGEWLVGRKGEHALEEFLDQLLAGTAQHGGERAHGS
jgi:4-hydroxy-tetrahydrodipicolinate reductase